MKNIFSKNKIFTLMVIFMAFGILFFGKNIFVDAAITPLLDFQGKIINSNGTNVANNVYDFQFKIYDDSLGGTLLWSEDMLASTSFAGTISNVTPIANGITYTFTPIRATSTLRVGQHLTNASASSSFATIIDVDAVANQVTVASGTAWSIGDSINNRPRVDGGVAMLNLGTISDLTSLDFNSSMYLETTFNGEVMQPRKLFTSVSQSFNSSLLNGRAETEFASLADNEIITGQWSFTDIVDMSASSTSAALSITQNGSGNLIEIKNGGTTAFSILNDGRVAIGAYILPASDGSPGYVLKSDGSGNVSWQVDLAGFGGSGLWATSSNSTIIRPVDTSQIVVVGNTATSSSGYIFEVDGSSLFDNISVSDGNEVRFYDTGNTNYFAFKASSTLGVNRVFTLPTNAYANDDYLMVDSNGNMFWGNRAGLWGTSGSNAYYTAGNILIGTTSDNGLLTVGANLGNQFLVNTNGQVTEGEWLGTDIGVARGGTGRSSWTQYAIPFATTTGELGEITIGTGDYLLAVNPGATGYTWIDPNTVGTNLSLEQVEDIAGNLVASSSGIHTLISVLYDDANSNMDFIVEMDLSQYSNATSSFFSTTTDLLGVAYGGTGTTTFEANSLLYASAQNIIAEVLQGTSGYILQSVSGVPSWVATSSLGIDFNAIAGTLDTSQGGTGQDSSGWNGIAFVTGGTWSAVPVLPVLSGGTGTTSLNDLITLGTHTTGNYLANATGTGSIIVTGSLGEGVTRIIDVLDDSITPTELAVSGNGTSGYILTSNGSGGFTWVAQGSVGSDTTLTQEQVEDFAGSLIATTTGTHTLITITYDDANNNMDFVVDDSLNNYTNDAGFLYLSSISAPLADGITYNNTNGQFTVTNLYNIPLIASTTEYDTAYSWGDHSIQNYFDKDTDVLAIASGGTGSTTAVGARGELGLGSLATQDTINNLDWSGNELIVANGGTGLTSYATGSIIYASGENSLGEILKSASTSMLLSIGVGGTYEWIDKNAAGLSRTDEDIEDVTGAMIATTSLISVTYSDNGAGNGKIEYSVVSDLSLFDNSISQFFSTTTDILALAYGGTGAVTAAAARVNLGLNDVATFGINATGTNGQVWQSDGDGRGQWVATSSLGFEVAGVSKFIGTTTVVTDGSFATSTFVGYQAGNQLCADEFSGAYMCRTYDILVSIEQDNILAWSGTAWVAEGPPGYTSNSNDCQGWTSNSNTMLGAFWALDSAGGGMGWLTNCEVTKPVACCSVQ